MPVVDHTTDVGWDVLQALVLHSLGCVVSKQFHFFGGGGKLF